MKKLTVSFCVSLGLLSATALSVSLPAAAEGGYGSVVACAPGQPVEISGAVYIPHSRQACRNATGDLYVYENEINSVGQKVLILEVCGIHNGGNYPKIIGGAICE